MSKTLEYTDKMLGENFAFIEKFMTTAGNNIEQLVANEGSIIEALSGLTTLAERNEARIKALENITLVVKAPKSSKLFLIAVAGGAFYAGYKYAEKNIKSRVYEAIDEGFVRAKDGDGSFEDRRQPHPENATNPNPED